MPDRPLGRGRFTILPRGSGEEVRRIAVVLRSETIGGVLLLLAAALAMAWANSPWSSRYHSLLGYTAGPSSLDLKLTLSQWAADGLLAIFFFVAGLELKREFIAGDLRDPRRAVVPVAAAFGGVAVPAIIFTVLNLSGDGDVRGWAIPTATDIAFALAVLAIVGTHLPTAMRTFLLTLAVVDDLIAIVIIAIYYTSDLTVGPLLLTVIPLAAFGFAVQKRVTSWWLLVPLALATWALVHASGVHATVAAVLLAFTVPVRPLKNASDQPPRPSLAEQLENTWRPVSTVVAVPVFAFFSVGVTVGGLSGLQDSVTDQVALGVIAGLIAGKTIGVFGATWLTARFTRADLDDEVAWSDIFGLAVLCGVGFTVSLLIGELAFGVSTERGGHVKVAILVGSVTAALLGAVLLRRRNNVRRIAG